MKEIKQDILAGKYKGDMAKASLLLKLFKHEIKCVLHSSNGDINLIELAVELIAKTDEFNCMLMAISGLSEDEVMALDIEKAGEIVIGFLQKSYDSITRLMQVYLVKDKITGTIKDKK